MSSSDTPPSPQGPVLVTGGTGLIGRHVVGVLKSQGRTVTVSASHAEEDSSGVRLADLRDPQAATDLVEGHAIVVHLAARQGGIAFQERPDPRVFLDNVTMTQNVLSAAQATGVRRVVLASSAVVYSREAQSPIDEDEPLLDPQREPVSPYAWSKVTDEVAARWVAPDCEVVTARFTNVYGPGSSFDPSASTVVHALLRKALEVPPRGTIHVWGDGTARRSFVYVQDAARALVTLLDRGAAGQAYNVSTSGDVSIRQLAEAIRSAAAPRAELAFDPSAPSGPPRRTLDHSALYALGFRPQFSLQEGLAATIDHASQVLGLHPGDI